MQRADAQRADADAFQPLIAERTVEAKRRRAAARRTQREEESDRTSLEPASGELEHARRGAVEPLDVVDRDDDRSRRSEVAEDGDRRSRDGALTGDGIGATRPQQRNFERVPLRRRKRSEDVGFDALQ